MIAQSFYMLGSCNENMDDYKPGDIGDFVVCKHGKLLNSLSRDDDLLYTIITIPDTTIEEENCNTIVLHGAIIDNKQALGPGLMESIISTDKEDIYAANGSLFRWAFEHRFKSTLIHYFDKYPTSRKYIDGLIYKHISKFTYTDLTIFLIERYSYDVEKDGNKLFDQAASVKNDLLCRYLIEQKDVMIPSLLYKIYMNYGKRYADMFELFREHSDKVELS